MKLYSAKGAPNPDRVTFFLKEKGKLDEVEIIELALLEGEHRSSDYKSVNELARVPSLKLDDGTVIGESRAICTYLESTFPEPNLMGRDGLERAQIEMWDRRVELMLMMSIAGWFRHGHPRAAALEAKQSKEWSEMSEEQTLKTADYFDRVLERTEFVAGDRFTNADITLFICMNFGLYMRCKLWEGRPNLSRWFEAMQARPMAAKD
ncbi:glutathione S-transferase family protein [Ponticaulis sp.]|uniref:glutathione S-transferase family protein n=1 Tax=Ponticaulis sp. TaxID=2020902 RepID=UPI000B74AB1C|nr:glutathione S-transferase family protein [Ponticaulis sp.]MAJ09272.1 glutathione S-transferase [Ponticaulis sp.]HBH89089.1 glutathione S-transferase family protein [Hyphomonadaceae bacterium]HBJ91273.1 glutathione S-transferase family protein [Hyphomonadaceae bacterium]|tara:strand:+ start:11392 stop:12012 length:621 start_codon:yes stop_codon:yes gene_type:complete